jgi:hypothetical protein
MVVGDLREHARKIKNAAWVKALHTAPFVQEIANSPEMRKFHEVEALVKKRLKVGFDQLRDDVLGDAVVFAYRPGPPNDPRGEQGVALIWARDPRLLAQVVDLVNTDLKKLDQRLHHGGKYFRRTERNGKITFYYLSGPMLAFSSQEAMLRQVIERSQEHKLNGATKAGGSIFEHLRRLGADKALLALWFNPRAFDAHLASNLKAARGPQAFVLNRLFGYWKAMEGAALAVSLGKEVQVKLAVRAQPDKLPPAARRFFNEASKLSDLWGRFPADALLATAGCIDGVAFAAFVGDFLPAPARQAGLAGLSKGLEGIGLDLEKDVLPALGPDVGCCVIAPTDKKVLIPSVTWALRVRPGPNKKRPVDQMLVGGLNSLAILAVLSQPDHVRLRSTTQDKVEIKYLESKAFPPGIQPAFALKEGFLLLASSPEAIRGFTKQPAARTTAAGVPLLRVSLAGWARFLKDRREAFIQHVAAKDHVSRYTAARQLDVVLWGLELFDQLELRQRTGSGMVTWSLALRPAGPGKK